MPVEFRSGEPGATVVAISGRLVFGKDVQQLETLVKESIAKGQKRLVFDATTLDYVDSSGIGALVFCLTEIRKAGGELRVAGANPRVQRLFAMTGIDKLLAQYPTVADATVA